MKSIVLKTLSYLALAATIVPPLMVFLGNLDINIYKQIITIAMVVWFATAPFWINKKSEEEVLE